MSRYIIVIGLVLLSLNGFAQDKKTFDLTPKVNVFLGTSGDHGQLSPAASYPFGILDNGPQTYPNLHSGYEHKAKVFLGFTHGRLEGVGCMGSGGNILVKPFMDNPEKLLLKKSESGEPGYYAVSFSNGVRCRFTLKEKSGIEQYHFPTGRHGFYIDLAYTLTNGFKAEKHQVSGNTIIGWIESGTTCRVGTYRIYYALEFDHPVNFIDSASNTFTCLTNTRDVTVRVGFSSVSEAYAKAAINKTSFEETKRAAAIAWTKELNRIRIAGDPQEEKLFYSLLYRCIHAPFDITERDGSYRGSDGKIYHTDRKAYSGWTIWDNYKTTLPLLSITAPNRYQDMVTSIANLYKTGKKSWATATEPCNSVRTEHAIVVLLDAYNKGYKVDFAGIKDSLLKEANNLDFSKPDKALESSYDCWAMGNILKILNEGSAKDWLKKTANWQTYWHKDFENLGKPDVDELSARNMYQGTIWQYRWFVPFDQKGLIQACGGETNYLKQLDEFFDKDYYNAANEPDIQVPYLYNGTSQPYKSQNIIHKYAKDTVIQYYEDDNYRGIDPQIKRVYNNHPDGLLQTMDDDMGAMSAWYVLAAIGLSPACVGTPVWYLHVPLFPSVIIGKLHIQTNGKGRFIQSLRFNDKPLERNWLTQQEIMAGGRMVIYAGKLPNKSFGIKDQFITSLNVQ
ncbi:MAG: glycoside hydrolase domain-containing protein [Mucilaginibacter sp.]